MTSTGLRPGGNVDSWCGKCKLFLAHTIEAMVGEKPMRVHCNTCKTQHAYRPHPPAEPRKKAAKAEGGAAPKPTGRTRASKYQTLLNSKDMALAKAYSIKDIYAPGDVVKHPSFGVGVVTALKDGTKVEFLFETGPKLLVHGR
jgi:hypothetical protein